MFKNVPHEVWLLGFNQAIYSYAGKRKILFFKLKINKSDRNFHV